MKKKRLALCLGVFTAVALAYLPIADNTIFELDGNADDGAPVGIDWKSLNPPGNSVDPKATYTHDLSNSSSDDIFTGGGSKDTNDVGQWRWTNQTAPDKNDLENCYAYPKLLDKDLRIYFGCDRYATDGDSDVGWWFFQSDVAPITSGPDTGKFTGGSTVGDILVLTHFTTGGKVPDIKIRRVSAIDNKGNVTFSTVYDSTTAGGSADCQDANVNPLACSTVNSGPINVDWSYIAKVPPAAPNNVPAGGFIEGGINLSQILAALGLPVPCLSSYLARTTTAAGGNQQDQFKDFTFGNFEVCSMTISKTCDTASISGGDTVHYTFSGVVTNTGIGALYTISVTDQFPSGATNTSLVQPTTPVGGLLPNGTVQYTGSFDLNAASGVVNATSSSAAATDGGSQTVTAVSGPWTGCSAAVSPGLHVHKACETVFDNSGGQLVLQVNVTGSVCNDGNVDVLNVTVNDSVVGTVLTVPKLDAPTGGQTEVCQNFSASYKPSVCVNPLEGGRCKFEDTASASGTGALNSGPVSAPPVQATCYVCPTGSCVVPTQP